MMTMNIRMNITNSDAIMAAKAIEIAIDISKGSFTSLADLFEKKCLLEYLPKGPKTDITHTLEELYPEFVNPKDSIPISEKEQYLLMRVFEMIARIGLGQFITMIEFISPLISYEDKREYERRLKNDLINLREESYWAITNSKVSQIPKFSWYLYQLIRRELSWYIVGKDWRKDPRDWGTMMTVNFDDPYPDFKTVTIIRY
jgi:hypothetical protein